MRDSQRSKLYKAEDQCWPGHKNAKHNMSLEDVKGIVRGITTSPWWKERVGESQWDITVDDGRGHRSAMAYYRRITMPRFARSMSIILHELTHILTKKGPSHGREYAKNYLAMVERWMGPLEAARLRECFRANHVHWHPKRQLTDAQRQALRDRFAACRKEKPCN